MSKKGTQSSSMASTSASAAICPESDSDLEIPSWQPKDIDDYCAPFIDNEDWFTYLQETGPHLPGQFTQPEWLQDNQDEDPEWLYERQVIQFVDGKDFTI